MKYEVIVIGASAGGVEAISAILTALPEDFSAPLLIVQHLSPHSDNYIVKYLNEICKINVKEAEEKEKVLSGNAYFAPPNYHVLVEMDGTLSLSVDRKVNYSRPSIDVLFESAADVYCNKLIGVILTGANSDGSRGLKKIKEYGGITLVQEPNTAEVSTMPKAAIDTGAVDYILTLQKISMKLIELVGGKNEKREYQYIDSGRQD